MTRFRRLALAARQLTPANLRLLAEVAEELAEQQERERDVTPEMLAVRRVVREVTGGVER